MCKCEKCGGVVCPDCGRAECATGSDECLQAQIRGLREKVKELEARPTVQYVPYLYQVPVQPNLYPWYNPIRPTIICDNTRPMTLTNPNVNVNAAAGCPGMASQWYEFTTLGD